MTLDELYSLILLSKAGGQTPISYQDIVGAIQSQYTPQQFLDQQSGAGQYISGEYIKQPEFVAYGRQLQNAAPIYTPSEFVAPVTNDLTDGSTSFITDTTGNDSFNGDTTGGTGVNTSAGNHGGISAANGQVASTIAGILGGIVAGPIGSLAGRAIGKWGVPAAVNANNSAAIAANLGIAGFSPEAISAAQAAAQAASGQSGATAGSIAAAAAQAAAVVDKTDPLDAMFSVTNNFSTGTEQANTNASMTAEEADVAYSAENYGGDSGGYDGSAIGGGYSDGSDGGYWAKGGMVTQNRLIGPDPKGQDTGYGGLQDGEFVIKKSSVEKYGDEFLSLLNSGKLSKKKVMSLL